MRRECLTTGGDERYNLLSFANCSTLEVMPNAMNTLDQALETALQLPYEQQEMLIKILQNRHHESRRAEIAADAQQTLVDFRTGKFRHQSAENVIAELRQTLQEPEA